MSALGREFNKSPPHIPFAEEVERLQRRGRTVAWDFQQPEPRAKTGAPTTVNAPRCVEKALNSSRGCV